MLVYVKNTIVPQKQLSIEFATNVVSQATSFCVSFSCIAVFIYTVNYCYVDCFTIILTAFCCMLVSAAGHVLDKFYSLEQILLHTYIHTYIKALL